MSSRCRDRCLALLVSLATCASLSARELVVCADPDNLPYSNESRAGFENRIAQIVADEIGATLRYRWQPLRRGVVRKTLDARACDALVGVPVGMEGVATTAPYYRSTYAFVHRESDRIDSLDDPRLHRLSVGIALVGADMQATPAALALAQRGVVSNVRGFPVYGATPVAERMIESIDRGDLDVAIVWGPQAGYYVQRAQHALVVSPMHDEPMTFAIAMAVREDKTMLRDELDRALARASDRVRAVLVEFGVPLMP